MRTVDSRVRSARRITVLTWSRALGDTLLLVPLLRALRETAPDASLHLIAAPDPAGLLRDAGLVDTVGDNDEPTLGLLLVDHAQADRAGTAHRLGDPDFMVVIARDWQRVVEKLSGAGISSVGADSLPEPGRHAAEEYLHALDHVVPAVKWDRPDSVAPLIDAPPRGEGPILLHPGSGANWKCPPLAVFRKIGAQLNDRGYAVTVLAGPAEEVLLDGVEAEFPIVRPASVRELRDCLLAGRGFVGCDSGVSHLAGLVGLPVVALFGPTHPVSWSPLGPWVSIVRECSKPPGQRIRVCEDGDCFHNVNPEVVAEELVSRWARAGQIEEGTLGQRG